MRSVCKKLGKFFHFVCCIQLFKQNTETCKRTARSVKFFLVVTFKDETRNAFLHLPPGKRGTEGAKYPSSHAAQENTEHVLEIEYVGMGQALGRKQKKNVLGW